MEYVPTKLRLMSQLVILGKISLFLDVCLHTQKFSMIVFTLSLIVVISGLYPIVNYPVFEGRLIMISK